MDKISELITYSLTKALELNDGIIEKEPMKAVTLRLKESDVKVLDSFGDSFGITRQDLLLKIVTEGLDNISSSIAEHISKPDVDQEKKQSAREYIRRTGKMFTSIKDLEEHRNKEA